MKKIILLLMMVFTINLFGEPVKATEFQLKDQFKKEHTLEQYRGKKVFLIFWTSWCGYCTEAMKDLKDLYIETGENKKDIIFLTFNDEEEKVLRDVLKERDYKFPVINDKIIFYKYYINSYPTTYIINEDGKVVQVINGYVDKKEFNELIENQNYEIKKEN